MKSPSRWNYVRIVLALLALVAVFVFDDVLYFLLIERLMDLHLSGVQRFMVLAVIFALNVLLAYAIYSVLRRRPTTGKEGLIGERGKALSVIDTDHGWVLVHGERWQARSEQAIPAGTTIEVVAVEGLQLVVRPRGER